MKWLDDLLRGGGRAGQGIGAFYRDWALWRFALAPLGLLILLYGGMCWAALAGGAALAEYLQNFCAHLPGFLQWLSGVIRWTVLVTAFAGILLLIAFTVSTLYELLGGLFFDGLIAEFERRKFHTVLPEKNAAFTLRFLLDSCLYSLGTLFWMIATALAGLFFPVVGQLAAIVLVGYRFGVVYVAAAGFNYHWSLAQTRCWCAGHMALTVGFGVIIYLILLIPPAVVFCLPGFVLGGVLLLRGAAENAGQRSSIR